MFTKNMLTKVRLELIKAGISIVAAVLRGLISFAFAIGTLLAMKGCG